jgi:hypothetical protein
MILRKSSNIYVEKWLSWKEIRDFYSHVAATKLNFLGLPVTS